MGTMMKGRAMAPRPRMPLSIMVGSWFMAYLNQLILWGSAARAWQRLLALCYLLEKKGPVHRHLSLALLS